MTLRRALFWIHLTAECVAGRVILVMSATGVLLAYRRQVTNWSERSLWTQPAQRGVPGSQFVRLLFSLQLHPLLQCLAL